MSWFGLWENRMVAVKAMREILDDYDWWDQQRSEVLQVLTPLFVDGFIQGAQIAAATGVAVKDDLPVTSFDIDAVNRAAIRAISEYTSEWWQLISERQRETLRAAILAAEEQGLSVRQVMKLLAPAFGEDRAKLIAITEMTTVLGRGAQEQYRLSGYQWWEWRTVGDARVDPTCQQLSGERFPISEPFSAAHPSCRCWPVSVGESIFG